MRAKIGGEYYNSAAVIDKGRIMGAINLILSNLLHLAMVIGR